MKVYLMRHAEAQPGARNDDARDLTVDGVHQAEDMATWLSRQIGRVDIVICSPFRRALHTAEIMAQELGAHVATTKMLEPDADPKESWKEIERLAQQSGDVLVVGHHPNISHLINSLAEASGIGHSFGHASIAFIVPKPDAIMYWMVDHTLVARDIEFDAEEAGIIANAFEAADAALELVEALERRSLQHPDHQRIIAPIRRKVAKLIGGLFRDQGAEIVQAVKPWLKLHMREAEGDEPDPAEVTAASILPDTLTPFVLNVSTEQASQYRDLIAAAMEKAAAALEAELNAGASIPETEMTSYLRSNSLEKLTGGFSNATKQRLRNAIADTIRAGGTSTDIVQAIEDTVEEFATSRAELIAQTEVNNAYSFGRDALARNAGLEEKSWVTESDNPCLMCMANEAEGWIPIDQAFSSGDNFPGAHPRCECGCDYRTVSKALPAAA